MTRRPPSRGPLTMGAPPKQWRHLGVPPPPDFGPLERALAETKRLTDQYPGRRQVRRATYGNFPHESSRRGVGGSLPTGRINAAEVYARRAAEAAAPPQVEPGAGPRARRPRTLADLTAEIYQGQEDT
jgi:hypothetical protein